jgi:hypothetical protein
MLSTVRGGKGELTAGVCLSLNECFEWTDEHGGGAWANRCGNKALTCCTGNKCGYISNNKCPGGSNVKCWDTAGYCYYVSNNKCPGRDATRYKRIGDKYKDANGRYVKC